MREQTPFSKLPIGQKAAWIVGLIVMTILAVNAVDGDDTPSPSDRVDTAYPAGAYAECSDFHDLESRFAAGDDVDSNELLRALLDLARAAEGGPVEAEAMELLDALTSGDEARNHAAINAMRTACNSG